MANNNGIFFPGLDNKVFDGISFPDLDKEASDGIIFLGCGEEQTIIEHDANEEEFKFDFDESEQAYDEPDNVSSVAGPYDPMNDYTTKMIYQNTKNGFCKAVKLQNFDRSIDGLQFGWIKLPPYKQLYRSMSESKESADTFIATYRFKTGLCTEEFAFYAIKIS